MTPTSPPVPSRPLAARLVALGQDALLSALPTGGQRVARRNAWAGMSAESALGRDRREAEAALQAADRHTRAGRRASG